MVKNLEKRNMKNEESSPVGFRECITTFGPNGSFAATQRYDQLNPLKIEERSSSQLNDKKFSK